MTDVELLDRTAEEDPTTPANCFTHTGKGTEQIARYLRVFSVRTTKRDTRQTFTGPTWYAVYIYRAICVPDQSTLGFLAQCRGKANSHAIRTKASLSLSTWTMALTFKLMVPPSASLCNTLLTAVVCASHLPSTALLQNPILCHNLSSSDELCLLGHNAVQSVQLYQHFSEASSS
jgi:hypothetical protein